jgi:hypothetical protein
MSKTSRFVFFAAGLIAVLTAQAVRAQSEDFVLTVDLPFDASQPLPAWMHGAPVSVSGDGSRVAFALSPPAGRDLLLHFVFDEVGTGTNLRVDWMRDGSSVTETIAEDLGEGLGVPNQRPLLISASRLGGDGSLLLQGGDQLRITRVRFEWVSERTMLASSSRYVPVVVTASRLTLAEADVDGGPRAALRDEWRDRVVRAVLTEKAEPLTPSITLVAPLEQAPLLARFEVQLAGVHLDQEVWLVLNDQEIGPLAIEVPTLEDPGHLGRPGREAEFAGWRNASVYVPVHLLAAGDNNLVLELRSPVNSGYANAPFLREAILELCYPPPLRDPDLTLPVRDLPPPEDEQLPPVSTTPASTGEILEDFWRGGSSSAL